MNDIILFKLEVPFTTRKPASIIIELMHQRPEGYEEVEHTADWELHVWGETLSALFEQAAQGMYALSGVIIAASNEMPRLVRTLELVGTDHEALLVSFLSELLLFGEDDRLAFDQIDLQLTDHKLLATLNGNRIVNQEKEIKAVTFHNMNIQQEAGIYQVNIVFDV